MAYPDKTTPRSYGGAVPPSYLTTDIPNYYVANQSITIESAAGWYEVSDTGQATTTPLGTRGPFVVTVNAGEANEERILCSDIDIEGNFLTVWTDGVLNGRGYDGTIIQWHYRQTTQNKTNDIFHGASAVESLQFNEGIIAALIGGEGSQGPQGVQGSQGAQGNDGAQGTQGNDGSQGAQGSQGEQGAQGNQGATGTGTQGPQGATGTGTQGFQGAQGRQGAQGTTGSQGTTGTQGSTGSQGTQGNQGFQGTTGVQGSTGAQGSTGSQGTQGSQGFQGTTGSQGATGTQGSTGAQGNQGFQGTTGSQGNTGAQGSTGAQGTQGYQGNQGQTGSQGTQGNTGSQGSTGSQGNQGSQGQRGFQGYQGQDGAQGFQGHQGQDGPQGSTGAQGFQGYQGNDGQSDHYATTSSDNAYVVDTGSAYLIVETGLSYTTGQDIVVAHDSTHLMHATVTGYSSYSGRLDFDITNAVGNGSGPYNSWTINLDGAVGVQGTQGYQGLTGSQGFQGGEGPQGNEGPQGQDGLQGPQGNEGIQGSQGQAALWNFAGPYNPGLIYTEGDVVTYEGQTWYRKIYGASGHTPYEDTWWTLIAAEGNQGAQGLTGDPGIYESNDGVPPVNEDILWLDETVAGYAGPQGPQGVQGVQGARGYQGSVGAQGASGTNGTNGSQGAQGTQGLQGSTGSQGSQGNAGTQGPQGASGTNGSQGPQGSQGNQGNSFSTDDSGWIAVSSFTNSFVVGAAVAYRKLNGIVYLRGSVQSGTPANAAFTLPTGYRPSETSVFAIQQYGLTTNNYITINTDGTVVPQTASAWLNNVVYPIG